MRGRFAVFLTIVLMLVVLVALNAATYVRVEQQGDSELAPDRSTTNAGPTGTRALYEYLQQSGRQVVRWGQPITDLLGSGAARPTSFVVVGQLRNEFEEDDAEALLRWVEEGGRLVIIDRQPPTKLIPEAGGWHLAPEIFDTPTPDVRPDNVEQMTRGVPAIGPTQPTPLTRNVAQVTRSRFASRLHVYPTEQRPADVAPTLPPDYEPEAEPSPTSRIEEEASEGEAQVDEEPAVSPAPVVHLADGRSGEGALLVDYSYGRGRVVVLSDPFVVSNAGLRLADNLMLAVNVVAGAGGGVIAFDEYHQGYGASRTNLLSYFAGTPVLWMLAQGGLLVLAILWTRGRRFARPLPAPRVDRRSKLEFVASMAELQRRARAYDLAIENVYTRTRRALARYSGTSAAASAAHLAERVAARSGRDARPIEELLKECEDAVAGEPVSARRALQLVAALRQLERDLGIRMRAREARQTEQIRERA